MEKIEGKIQQYLETRLWNCKKKKPEAKLPKTSQLLGELKTYYFVPISDPKIAAKFKQKITAARIKISKKYKSTHQKIETWSKAYHLPRHLLKQWVLNDECVTDKKTASSAAKIIKDWQQFAGDQEEGNHG
ncbi:MAG: hypothetical protein JJV89_02975 [Desulfosarcina sp.]|nr:hypothetical protein [Desulfobacterales bacterium]